jgi:CheY-like chemotaxis protein/two-component sensor histidine kinase
MKKIIVVLITVLISLNGYGQSTITTNDKVVNIISSYSYENEFAHFLVKGLKKELKELIPNATIINSYTDIAYAKNYSDAVKELNEALLSRADMAGILIFIGDEAWMTYRSLGRVDSTKIIICSTNDIICHDYNDYFNSKEITEENSLQIDSSIKGYNAYVIKYSNTLEQTTKLIKNLLPEIDKYLYISKKTFSDKRIIDKLENLVGINNMSVIEIDKNNPNFLKEAAVESKNIKSVLLVNNYNIWSLVIRPVTIPIFFLKQTYTSRLSTGGVYEDLNKYASKTASTVAALYNGISPDFYIDEEPEIKTFINGNIADKLKIEIPANLSHYVIKMDNGRFKQTLINIITITIISLLLILTAIFTIRWRIKSKRIKIKINKYSKLFNHYNTIYNNSPAAFAIFDENNDLVESNREYEKLIKPLIKVVKSVKKLKMTDLPIVDEQIFARTANGEVCDMIRSYDSNDNSSIVNYRILIQPMDKCKLLMIWDNTQVYLNNKNQEAITEIFKTALREAKITFAEIDLNSNSILAGERWFENLNLSKCDFPECFLKVREEDRLFCDNAILKIKAGKKETISKNIGIQSYDKIHWYNISFKMKDNSNNTKVLCTLCDINHLIERELNLKKESDNFIRLKELKNSFILNMSHEIKTPLNAIVGFSELIIESQSNEEKNELLKYIRENNEKLLSLISDIVDMLNIETGEMICTFSEINIKELVTEIYNEWHAHTQPDVKFNLLADENCIVYSDYERLKQAIVNLVSNSIQYTNSGYVELSYNCHDENVTISVKDTGCGISPEKQKKLFERFNQLKKEYMGTGLGLPIVNSIVKLLNGKIRCESSPNTGTTITITIPIGMENIESQTGIKERLEKGITQNTSTNQKVILIAEDNENNYQLLNFMLKRNYKILHATNGQEVIDMFKKNKPDMILMDIKMPVKDGYQATAEIRELSNEIPIIAVTAYAFDSDRDKVMSSAFTGYIAKPVDEKELIELITKSLDK